MNNNMNMNLNVKTMLTMVLKVIIL